MVLIHYWALWESELDGTQSLIRWDSILVDPFKIGEWTEEYWIGDVSNWDWWCKQIGRLVKVLKNLNWFNFHSFAPLIDRLK
jgi:hypothetical protein